MADKRPETIGRGGRGALLLAALQNQPRRPGQTSPVSSSSASSCSEQPEDSKPLGRGALLQSVLSQARGRAIPLAETSEPRVGRGRGLALSSILSAVGPGRGHAKSETSPEKSISNVQVPGSPPSPPVSEFEELSIGKYSGTSGTPLKMEVNYVHLKISPDKGIYEYHVTFVPSVDSKSMKFRLINQPAVRERIGNVKIFDGSIMYLPVQLPSSINVAVNMPTDNSSVTVTIKLVKKCKPSDCIHLYNLLLRKVMIILKMSLVGRNHFDPTSGIHVPQHKLEIWPGYVTAVQDYEGGVMLNCDVSFKVLRTETAYDLMHDATRQQGAMREAVAKVLLGCVVLTRYNNKTYRIDDIAWDKNPTSSFLAHNGQEIKFVDYYKKSYDIEIKDLRQPLLVSKSKDKGANNASDQFKMICLIPELCLLTGLTDSMRNDYKVMKDIAVFTRVTPEQRQLALKKFIHNVNDNPEAKNCFNAWNLELDTSLVSLDGRILKPELLQFGNDMKIQANPEADWGRQVASNKVLVPVNFKNWIIVFVKRDSSRVMEFIKMLRSVCPAMGISVNEPIRVDIPNDRTETYCEVLKSRVNPSVQMVVVVFPTARDDRYSAIKKLCCIEMPVPSQVINTKTISDPRKLRSVVQKIALQMNCKLGGELWSVHIPMDNLMVCGLDTYHDITRGKRSVLAFVASINQNRTRWFSMTTLQKVGQEMGDSLKMLFTAALKKYYEVNHRLPDKIVLYRDGVSDGQMDYVARYEVEQLASCFKHFSVDYSPTLSVVVVQKRINTRIFEAKFERHVKSYSNPPPGSILDHTVTRKKLYDFFLISQHVRQGTVSPTHYVVIHDNSALKPEHMQRLAYKMTHLYYNWPGTVRVPAPCQYAHKLAYLVGQSLHRETHADLSDKLFYL